METHLRDLISAAAEAVERFDPDELEEHARLHPAEISVLHRRSVSHRGYEAVVVVSRAGRHTSVSWTMYGDEPHDCWGRSKSDGTIHGAVADFCSTVDDLIKPGMAPPRTSADRASASIVLLEGER